ncbi:stress up-regulated Nod 19 [Artemisia annua]|uniref:Stress up-regulated Nod 19 n=1 Tax=Artemisia annua TaxID=35608 RepID=A0A2U1PM95_ARTAN|nr:stress up-regulated Nod 19 [Artemisia annua]
MKNSSTPDPYGIEVGNPLRVPAGYLEKWKFNIHAIDTCDAIDAMGCTQCRHHPCRQVSLPTVSALRSQNMEKRLVLEVPYQLVQRARNLVQQSQLVSLA